MQQYFNRQELQKVQDHFCTLTGLYAYCVDSEGRKITEMSGNREGIGVLNQYIPEGEFYRLFKRVSQSGLEDMVIEHTAYANIRLAAVSVRESGIQGNCFLICCVLDEPAEGEKLKMPGRGMDPDAFYEALDLIADVERKMITAGSGAIAEKGPGKAGVPEKKDKRAFAAVKAVADMLRLSEREGSVKNLGSEILCIAGEYLDISGGKLFQVMDDLEHVKVAGSFCKNGKSFEGQPAKETFCSDLLTGSRPLWVSSDMLLSAGVRGEMLKYHLKAFAAWPVFIDGRVGFYFCLYERERDKIWQAEDREFIEAAAKILQKNLESRQQKKEVSEGRKFAYEILDNMGMGVYVKESGTGKCLLANRLLKKTFKNELENGTLNMLLANARPLALKEGAYEVCHSESGRCYDLYHVPFTWIDGKAADLYSLYDVTDKRIYQKKMEQQIYTDFLTGLYNRICCERDLAAFIDAAKKNCEKGGLLYLDLDDFKHINDGLGHQYGDVLLQSVSRAFQRIEGIGETCYRMGGDEFVVIVPPDKFSLLEDIMGKIQSVFEEAWYLKNSNYYCTMSMGVCIYPDDGDSVADLIKKADISMYEAKRRGKNQVVRFSDNLKTLAGKRLDMEKSMRDAASADCSEFSVYFQPIIDIQRAGTPCMGAEALVRWNSTALGFIPPSDFIPLAEYLGLITPIGNYVLREACYACKKWNDDGYPEYKVNVNLSVVQLLQKDIVDVIKNALRDTGIAPHNLTLEVTESLAINDMKRMKEILGRIRKLGVRIALDDFGTGYSSLNYIREIPLDVIKVDRSFIKGLTEDEYSRSFIKMVAELAEAIDVSICVEGIETREQYKVLEGMKVRLVQGYYFDKPLPRDEFERKYVRS